MFFENLESLTHIQKHYQYQLIKDMSTDDYYTIQIDLPIVNNPYAINQSVQDVLSLMNQHHGQFIRILVSKIL